MFSGELAELAGVSVRTLRHYHDMDLLPEPPRTSTGYRAYGVEHLIQLLRITRLTALGIPLADLPAVLETPATAAVLLTRLDQEAAEQISVLEARRASIAMLRQVGATPDVPFELHEHFTGASESSSPDTARFERDLLILLGHLLGDDGPSRIAAALGMTDHAKTTSDALSAQFYDLREDASDRDVTDLTDELTEYLRPLMPRIAVLIPQDPKASSLMERFGNENLNSAQRRILRRVDQRLGRIAPPEV